jgi:uncharacterized surface protein with fasciclin (FAS1) repeats
MTKIPRLSILLSCVWFVVALTAPVSARTLVETARDSGSFKQLLRAIELAGLAPALSGEGPFTIFAPTDEAFFKIPKAALDDLLMPHNRDKLSKLLRHHVLAGLVVSRDFNGKRLEAIPLAGEALLLDARTQLKIGTARIVRSDLIADNGVIHVIDTVQIPSFDDAAK